MKLTFYCFSHHQRLHSTKMESLHTLPQFLILIRSKIVFHTKQLSNMFDTLVLNPVRHRPDQEVEKIFYFYVIGNDGELQTLLRTISFIEYGFFWVFFALQNTNNSI